jgi:hypothetical protein
MAWVVALLLLVGAGGSAALAADAKGDNKQAGPKTAITPAMSHAALAAQLALEGEQSKSPVMLLAAAELLADLKQSPRQSKAKVEKKSPAAPNGKGDLKLEYRALLDRARQLAKADPQLRTLVEARIEQMTSRGLNYGQGVNKESVQVQGVTFKVIDSGWLSPGEVIQYHNVIFEGGKPAIVLAIGAGGGDLDAWVYDDNTGGLIGADTDPTSNCVIHWTPRYEGPFTVRLKNVGGLSERYVLLANW